MPDPSKYGSKKEFMKDCVPALIHEGKEQDQAVAVCMSMWKRKSNMRKVVITNGGIKERLIFGNSKARSKKVEEKELDGVKHLVVPVVALVEGVLSCNTCAGPELVLSSEFADPVDMWNGKPVTFTHPSVNGMKVSANEPSIFEDFNIGTIFNARLKGKKLLLDAWINLERVEKLGDEVKALAENLRNKEVVEVSTGYFAKVLPQTGKYGGKAFIGIHKDLKPDHLAILGESEVGACSIEDGCGTNRTNSRQTESRYEAWVAMSKKKVAKVNKDDCLCNELDILLSELIKDNKISDVDKRAAIEIALEQSGVRYFSIIAVFEDEIIYRDYEKNTMYAVNYKATDKGDITINGDKSKVRPVTEFVRVKETQEVKSNSMDRDKLIQEILTNSKEFAETDKEFLATCSDDQLNKIHKLATATVKVETDDDADDKEDDDKEIVAASKSTADYIKELPAEVQTVINRGLKAHNKHVNKLISTILKSNSTLFEKDELKTMDIEMLEKLATLASKTTEPSDDSDDDDDVDYRLNKGAVKIKKDDENEAPPAPLVFELKKKSA